jgi:hypothetical protein
MADPPPDLLEYRFSTLPSPLQVSPASASSPGMINLWAAPPPGAPVFCSRIQIGVPIGETKDDLCRDLPSVTPNTTWWSVSSLVVEDGAELGLAPGISYALFTAICTSDEHWHIDYDLQFSIITEKVNLVEGIARIIVAETSGHDRSRLELRRNTYDVAKGPVTEYLDAVVTTAAPPAATGLPVAEFAAGQAFRLAWGSNAAEFAVHVGAATRPIWTGVDNELVLDRGVTADSTLTIVARGARGGVLMAATTVTVGNPVLTPASLTAQTLSAAGTARLAAAVLASLTTATLDVTGTATLTGGARASALVATGGARLNGAVGTDTAKVTGALTVRGDANLGAAAAATLTVASAVSMVNPRPIAAGNYTASSDGFVLGIAAPVSPGPDSTGIVYGYTAPFGNVYAHGGNQLGWRDSKNSWMTPCAGSFLMPVRRGAGFALWTQVFGTAPPMTFVWVPFGSSAQLTALTDEQAAAYGLPSPAERAKPVAVAAGAGPPIRDEIAGVVAAFAHVLGDRLTPELTERLRRAVGSLTTRP